MSAAEELDESGIQTLCTPVSYAEVFAGVRAGEEPVTQAFFEARGEIPLDGPIGRLAGSYLARYARSHGLELGNALIAAAAVSFGVVLWTLNRKHYPMSDVRFYDPAESAT